MSNSFAVEVQTDSSGQWYGNAARYTTEEGAQIAGQDLASRWMLVREMRVVPSDDQPSWQIVQVDGAWVKSEVPAAVAA
jgi:hypothetical protein